MASLNVKWGEDGPEVGAIIGGTGAALLVAGFGVCAIWRAVRGRMRGGARTATVEEGLEEEGRSEVSNGFR